MPSSSTPMHWNISNAVLVRVGWKRKISVMEETAIFRLKSVNFFGKLEWRIRKIMTMQIKRIIGRIAVRKAFKKGNEGVNNFNSVSLLKQSNDTRDPEPEPILSIGVKRSVSIVGNLML